MKKSQFSLSRKGAGILLALSFLGVAITVTVISYSRQAIGYYQATRSIVDGYQGSELAKAAFQAGLLSLRSLPEKTLFTLGIISNPPRIKLSEDCRDNGRCIQYYITYNIQPEDGKLNLNHLVRNDDDVYGGYREIFVRLFEHLELDVDKVGAIIDWIDENSYESTGGGESNYYESLTPPRKIKNARMYSLSELSVVKNFDRNIVFAKRVPAEFAKKQKELGFQSELEEILIQDEDWVLANNVTAYYPSELLGTDTICVNAARYFVLLSLSNSIRREDVAAIFRLKAEKEGYIDKASDLKNVQELNRVGGEGLTLYEELFGAGSGSNRISGFLKIKSRFYRITGIGFVVLSSDNEERSLAVRRVWGIWDKSERELIYYSED